MRPTARTGATLILAAGLAAIPLAPALAQDSPLDRAVAAVGGADALDGLSGLQIEASGTRATIDEGPVPGGSLDEVRLPYTSDITIDVRGSRIRRDHTYTNPLTGQPREVTEIVTPDGGFVIGQDSAFASGEAPLQPDRIRSIRTRELLFNPQLLLVEALADPSMASDAGSVELDGTTYDAVAIERGDSPITLLLDPESDVIAAATRLESDALRRDVTLVVSYGDWAESESGLSFPGTIDVTYDGVEIQQETRSVTADADIDDAAFDPPAGVEALPQDDALGNLGDLRHTYLQSFAALGFPIDGPKTTVEATELSPGVWHVTGQQHHSLAVIQDEGVVIVETPYDETRSAAILEWLASVTDKPVTHVTVSHHHSDHSGGLRSLAGSTGAVAVVGDPGFFEQEVFGAPSELIPDGVDGSSIETMAVPEEGLVLDDVTNPVRILPFPNPHAQDYLLVQAGEVLWVVDFYSPATGAPVPDFLVQAVDGMGLSPTIIAGGHGGSEPWPPTSGTASPTPS